MDLLTRTLLRQYDSESGDEQAHRLVAMLRRQIAASSTEQEDNLMVLLLQIRKEMEQRPLNIPTNESWNHWVIERYRPLFRLMESLYHRLQDLPEHEYVPNTCTCGCGRDLSQDIFH